MPKNDNIKSKGKRTNFFNQCYFDELNNHNLYWLGFIAADGNIKSNLYNLNISLAEKDLDHLEKLKKDIESSKELYKRVSDRSNENPNWGTSITYYIQLNSSYMVKQLGKYNIKPTKTYTYFIPDEILNHPNFNIFLRGLVDGDGCYYKVKDRNGQIKFNLCGSEKSLTQIQNFIAEKIGIKTDEEPSFGTGIYYINYRTQHDVYKLINYIYKDVIEDKENSRYLERKYQIIKDWLDPNSDISLKVKSMEKPTKEKLEELYKEIKTLSGIAKKLTVKPATIKRWFEKFEIPHKTNPPSKLKGVPRQPKLLT